MANRKSYGDVTQADIERLPRRCQICFEVDRRLYTAVIRGKLAARLCHGHAIKLMHEVKESSKYIEWVGSNPNEE